MKIPNKGIRLDQTMKIVELWGFGDKPKMQSTKVKVETNRLFCPSLAIKVYYITTCSDNTLCFQFHLTTVLHLETN